MEFLSDPISFLGGWLQTVFMGWGLTPVLSTTLVKFISGAILATGSLLFVVFTIWLERKLYARIQDRLHVRSQKVPPPAGEVQLLREQRCHWRSS